MLNPVMVLYIIQINMLIIKLKFLNNSSKINLEFEFARVPLIYNTNLYQMLFNGFYHII